MALIFSLQNVGAAQNTKYEQAQTAVAIGQYPRAEGLLNDWLQDHEDDLEARFLYARVLAWQEKFTDALLQFDQILAKDPTNLDYILGKARVYYWANQPAQALLIIKQAEPSTNEELAALKSALEKEAVTAPEREIAKQSSAPIEMEAGFTQEHLSNGYGNWSDIYLHLKKSYGLDKTVYGTIRETTRFSTPDVGLLAGVYYPLSNRWIGLLEGDFSPSHKIVEKWSLLGQVERVLPDGWNVKFGYRHTEYNATNINQQSFSVERYWRKWRASYTFALTESEIADLTRSHQFDFSYYYSERNTIGFGFAFGHEFEEIPNRLIASDVREYHIEGMHWLRPRLAITYQFIWHKQGDLYNRTGANCGLRFIF